MIPPDPSLFRILEGHTHSVNALALAPKFVRAVSGSLDKTLRVWNLESGQTVRALEGHIGGVSAVATSPDKRWVVTASDDKTARLWLLLMNDLVDLARTIIGRNFFADEWQVYFPGEKYRKTFPDLPGPN